MDDFLFFVVVYAPWLVAFEHPFPFLGLVVVAAACSCFILKAMSSNIKWVLWISLFLAALWSGSLLILFVLKSSGFPPH
jgi:hypothetical protein